MNSIPLNLVSPKSLEKQLKVVESRIGELEAEITELEKIKAACLVLLGTAPQADAVETAAPATGKLKKKKTDAEEEAEEHDVINASELIANEEAKEAALN